MHLGELQRILKEYEPISICLQHINTPVQTIGKYSLAASSVPREGTLGTAIYVHHKVTYEKIIINDAYLQNSVLKLYLPDNKFITLQHL